MGQAKQTHLNKQDNRRSGGGRGKAKIRFEDYAFIRCELTLEEKEAFPESESAELSPTQALADLAIPGHKLSVSYGDGGGTVIASLTCTDPSDPNAGGVVTARGGDITKALRVLRYKIYELVGERLWREAESERGGSYSDIG